MTESPLPALPLPLAVACHDAGAANMLFAWLRAMARDELSDPHQWRLLLAGPALRLWQQAPVSGAIMYSEAAAALHDAEQAR